MHSFKITLEKTTKCEYKHCPFTYLLSSVLASKINYRLNMCQFWENLPLFLSLWLVSKSQFLSVHVDTDKSLKSVRKFNESQFWHYIASLKVLLNKGQIIEEMFSCSIFVSAEISLLNYLSLFSPFLLRFFSYVMFSDRKTALALLEDQAGWMLLSRVERGSCTMYCYIDTPELAWKPKPRKLRY